MGNRRVPDMTPEQEERLREAIRRADALENMTYVLKEHPVENATLQEQMADELRMLHEDAHMEVAYLKRAYGFDPF